MAPREGVRPCWLPCSSHPSPPQSCSKWTRPQLSVEVCPWHCGMADGVLPPFLENSSATRSTRIGPWNHHPDPALDTERLWGALRWGGIFQQGGGGTLNRKAQYGSWSEHPRSQVSRDKGQAGRGLWPAEGKVLPLFKGTRCGSIPHPSQPGHPILVGWGREGPVLRRTSSWDPG